jgi:hypothetical protein
MYLISVSSTSEDAAGLSNVTLLGEKKLSDQVRLILDHYKQTDPVGIPGAPIADPMPIPDMKHSFTYATMHFKSAHVHGLSRFRIEHIKSDLAAMQVGTPSCVGIWYLVLWPERRLRVFENRVLRRIFGPKRDEVTGGWIKLCNEELHGLYTSPNIIRMIKPRRMRWVGHVAHMGEMRNAQTILILKLKGKRTLGRPRNTWEDNIKMDLMEIRLEGVDWTNLAQDRYFKNLKLLF